MEKPAQNPAYAFVFGIDVSKDSLDVCLIHAQTRQQWAQKINNNKEGFKRMKDWVKQQGCELGQETLVCLEHTGLYTRQLVHYLLARQAAVWLESSLQIKRSIGLIRGKDDKVDAGRIARYALLHQHQAVMLSLSGIILELLKDLHANRNRLKKALQSLTGTIKELIQVDAASARTLLKVNKDAIKGLEKSLQQVEEKMGQFVSEDAELKRKFDLMTTIKGVGKVLAISLLIYTQGFTRMEDGRKLACYCGVAPFEYRSGTSVARPAGVSKFANQELKRVLHLAAMTSIQHNADLQAYNSRKVGAGKSKMNVLNAVRNKLLHLIVAVVKRGTPFQPELNNI